MLKERTQPFRALHGGAQRIAATVMARNSPGWQQMAEKCKHPAAVASTASSVPWNELAECSIPPATSRRTDANALRSASRSQRPVVGAEVVRGVLGRVGQVPGDRAVQGLVRVGLGPAEQVARLGGVHFLLCTV